MNDVNILHLLLLHRHHYAPTQIHGTIIMLNVHTQTKPIYTATGKSTQLSRETK